MLISLARKICDGNKFVKSGKWKGNSWDLFWGENLFSQSLGIIGLGNIGKEVAKKQLSFGLNVFYNNRNKLRKSLEKNIKFHILILMNL